MRGRKNADGLNPFQQRFCDAILAGHGNAEAARIAGYAHPQRSGSTTARQPCVVKYLTRKRALVKQELSVDVMFVVSSIVEVLNRCKQSTPVTVNGMPKFIETPSGEVAAAYEFDAANALKATDQLARYLGMYDHGQSKAYEDVESLLKTMRATILAEAESHPTTGDVLPFPSRRA